jgi:hypothetical protein
MLELLASSFGLPHNLVGNIIMRREDVVKVGGVKLEPQMQMPSTGVCWELRREMDVNTTQ